MAKVGKRILPSGKPQWRVSYIDANGSRKRPCFPPGQWPTPFERK